MYYAPRIFAKLALLAALLVAGASDAPASARQAAMPGLPVSIFSRAMVFFAEAEANGSIGLLLGGGAGFALAFFWLGRRSRAHPVPPEASRRVVRAAGAKRHERPVINGGGLGKPGSHPGLAEKVAPGELASVEEEAETFLLKGRVDMAIGVLRHYVEANDAAPAQVWMSLLAVLHAQGLRQEFEKLACEIRERFNIVQPTWEGANSHSNKLTGLEHFPRLFASISARWNSPGCLDYLRGLCEGGRNGARAGNLEAARDLLLLVGVLESRQETAEPPESA